MITSIRRGYCPRRAVSRSRIARTIVQAHNVYSYRNAMVPHVEAEEMLSGSERGHLAAGHDKSHEQLAMGRDNARMH